MGYTFPHFLRERCRCRGKRVRLWKSAFVSSGDEATAILTTGIEDTIRERAIAETPARTGREVVFKDEVTAIFTTDRELVGGERATLLPLRRALSYRISAGGI
jgi:hypothetical protein